MLIRKMKEKRVVGLKYKNKNFKIEVHVCTWFEKFLGLMFSRREKARALLFDFGKPVKTPIHSWFVFFPFVAIWLDDKQKKIDLKVVRPFTFCVKPKEPFKCLVEIPINQKYWVFTRLFVANAKHL